MIKTHTPGVPRIGPDRELKFALERFWRGEIVEAQLQEVAAAVRLANWRSQIDAGLDFITVGDFALYDHVLDHIQLFGCEPARFAFDAHTPSIGALFHDGARRRRTA